MGRFCQHTPIFGFALLLVWFWFLLGALASPVCRAAQAIGIPGSGEEHPPARLLQPRGSWEWEYSFRTSEAPSISQRLHLEVTGAIAPQLLGSIVFEHQGVWGAGNPLLRTSEVYVQLRPGEPEGWGSWRIGRLRFQLGPAGLLSANPFDALEGVHWQKAWSDRVLEAVWARLDTSYVTYLNYVYDTDEYLAFRASQDRGGRQAGLTWLADGLAGEHGVALDVGGTLANGRRWIVELAGYEASRSSYDYQGWVGAAVASIDLWADSRQTVSLTAASVHPGFTPMASNLRSAGGSIPFSNGSTGVELYSSHLIWSGAVGEIELRHQVRWGRPLSELGLVLSVGWPRPGTSTGRLQLTRTDGRLDVTGSVGFKMPF